MEDKVKFNGTDYCKTGLCDMKERYGKITLRQAVVAKCLECCCFQRPEVKLCTSKQCPLYYWKEQIFNHVKHY